MEPVDRFESERHFQVWLYSVSHRQLLLRSVKASNADRRIDVLFKNVNLIELPTRFDGLEIDRIDGSYSLSGADWRGRVEAGACFVADDDGEYHAPSPFARSLPTRFA